jgi:hypothetical protein
MLACQEDAAWLRATVLTVLGDSWENQLAVLTWQLEAMQALLQRQAAHGTTSASE